MKLALLLALAVGLFLGSGIAFESRRPTARELGWVAQANQLRGKSMSEARAILGNPCEVYERAGYTKWEYAIPAWSPWAHLLPTETVFFVDGKLEYARVEP